MRITRGTIVISVFGLYALLIISSIVIILSNVSKNYKIDETDKLLNELRLILDENEDETQNPWVEKFADNDAFMPHIPSQMLTDLVNSSVDQGNLTESFLKSSKDEFIVEIWSKAAIGSYLWEYIFQGEVEYFSGKMLTFGSKKIRSITFRYRSGPGVMPAIATRNTENVLLVLNGRESSKVEVARMWLDLLPSVTGLRNAAVLLLGNEQCRNDWIKSYVTHRGSKIRSVFIVYDSPLVDNIFFYQWPLGVATYRDFPDTNGSELFLKVKRKYLCNFLGTVYSNSSRVVMLQMLRNSSVGSFCYVKPRYQWTPTETDASRREYIHALQNSDFTLCPVGLNTESYRIYEAMSYGSIPVIEDVMTVGECGARSSSKLFPLRVLKESGAPVFYVKDWHQLPELLQSVSDDSLQIVERRRLVVLWYRNFKSSLQDHMVKVLESRFFGISI